MTRGKKIKKTWGRWRVLIQGGFLASLLAAVWYNTGFTGCSYLQIGSMRLICPVGFLEYMLSARSVSLELLPGFVLFIVVIAALGRVYCSWICPASFLASTFFETIKTLIPGVIRRPAEERLKRLRARAHGRLRLDRRDAVAILCGLALGIILAGYPAWSTICPVGLISRGLIGVVRNGELRLELLLLIVPLLIGLLHERGWKMLCPLGSCRTAASSLNRTLRVSVPENCNRCGRCLKACPQGLEFNPESGKFEDSACTKCLRCKDVCPRGKRK